MSRSSIWNRIFIVFIVSGFVIFKFVIYVPTSSFQNIITNVVTNISQSNSMEEIESTSENFMRVSLWFSSFGFWNYLQLSLFNFSRDLGLSKYFLIFYLYFQALLESYELRQTGVNHVCSALGFPTGWINKCTFSNNSKIERKNNNVASKWTLLICSWHQKTKPRILQFTNSRI